MTLTQRKGQYIPEGSDPIQEKFICMMMWRGQKATARNIFQGALEEMKKSGHKDPIALFKQALENVTPTVEVRPKRVGGAVYQVPVEVSPKRQISLSMRWLISESRKKKGVEMARKLALEVMDAANGQGGAFKKREDVHRMAEANKAFAHLAKY